VTEIEIHRRVVAHLRRAGVTFFHVPNEGKRGPRARSQLHGLGVMPGIPDLVIVDPPPALAVACQYTTPSGESLPMVRVVCGAVLELKSDTGRASPEQREWLAKFAELGWATACTKGLDEALAQLRAWGYIA
jgi:hypothetical protein